MDAENITQVRSYSDLARLREMARIGKKAVVVGGGYIGVEVAVNLSRMGMQTVIVEMLPHVLSVTTEPEFIPIVEDELMRNDIDLELGARVSEFDTAGRIARVAHLDTGERLEADFFVLSVGVRPNTALAESSALATNRFGIEVDECLRTSDSSIYASGDCAAKRSFVSGLPMRGEFGTNAVFMSHVVADNLLGAERKFPGVINANASKAFEWGIGSAGLTEKQAREAGFDVVTGQSKILDCYPMMDSMHFIQTKLIFDRATGRLLGGGVLRPGNCVAGNVDFLSLAIQKETTRDDLLVYQYNTHPELAAKPSDNMFVFAARDALF